ncbi:hypothetical protein C789_958 [Microcystis aeruginosa FACHB-905 = DIANCHI905]|uniref:Uncharacterized protein n=1 Tax=Microcystis aeruginosa PCC 7806SL TaxID=1903187 RepID=A0AB33BSX1_MICA7|nr:hypothetical protein BH695_3768 [Microcystis aeruginosa PCC 7806SL]ELS49247.1 hypothetical protein C789_958 [Microcystis aeruginosa FACHB-905 = DIANCHI905]
METFAFCRNISRLPINSLYSLEKLIEWKRVKPPMRVLTNVTLYSLEKLIEWKHLPVWFRL